MNKKALLIILAVVAVAAILAVCLYLFWPKGPNLGDNTITDYNMAATTFAQQSNKLGKNEILLADKIEEGAEGNITISFRLYSVADGYSPTYFMGMMASEAKDNPGLTDMGSAKASFLKGKPDGIFGLGVFHER